jgi:hypothetical protein
MEFSEFTGFRNFSFLFFSGSNSAIKPETVCKDFIQVLPCLRILSNQKKQRMTTITDEQINHGISTN